MRRYLHRGKLRCRRWMVGAMIPRTRELLMHVRQLSQLAIDDPGARARVRRAKRLLKVSPSSQHDLERCSRQFSAWVQLSARVKHERSQDE